MTAQSEREWVSTLLVVGFLLCSVSCFDYCTIPCRSNQQLHKHTMCSYPKEAPGQMCRSIEVSRELRAEDKDLLVKVHNQLRSKVAEGKERRGAPGPQPPAANMMELVWDNELELVARRWALQCNYNHDKCRITKSQEYVGQNLAVSYDSRGFMNDLEKMVVSWYDEVELAPSRVVNSFSSSAGSGAIGHYTQLIWATTNRIGCARVFFDFEDWGMTEYLVCNYAQGGNVNSQPIYKTGKQCSVCVSGLSCSLKYPGLCGAVKPGVPESKDVDYTLDYGESDYLGTVVPRLGGEDDELAHRVSTEGGMVHPTESGMVHSTEGGMVHPTEAGMDPSSKGSNDRNVSAAATTGVWEMILLSVLAVQVIQFF